MDIDHFLLIISTRNNVSVTLTVLQSSKYYFVYGFAITWILLSTIYDWGVRWCLLDILYGVPENNY